MIPVELAMRLQEQAENNPRVIRSAAAREQVLAAMKELNVPTDSKFGEFCLAYRLDAISGCFGNRGRMKDLCESGSGIRQSTRFVRDALQVSEEFICLDNAANHWCTLYSLKTGAIHEIGWEEVDALNAGELSPRWQNFHELMLDYADIPNQWNKPEFWNSEGAN